MAAFRFRLASVLRYRSRIREEKQGELQTLEGVKAQVLADISRQEQLIIKQAQSLEERQGQIVSALDVRLQGDFSQHVSQQIREHYRLLAIVQEQIEAKCQEVIQADKDVKSLDQLRVRLWDRHRLQEESEEQKRLDEVGQRQYYDKKYTNRE